MNRSIRSAALIGSCLLGVGCEQGTAPSESTFVPEAQFIPASSANLTTRISGLAWDPEAFYISLAQCGGPACPIPPFASEGIPLYQRSVVRGSAVSAFDPTTGSTVGTPASADPIGFWALPKVPSRTEAPFFITTSGAGALPTEVILPSPPWTPIPTTQYLPTLTMRPIRTVYGSCTSQEAFHIGRNGVLEAVAKYLTNVKGRITSVTDLVDPTQFHSVVVVDAFYAGNAANRAPADGVTVEASAGQVYNIDWGTSASTLRSARGFIVSETPTTPTGIAVVLVPATAPKPAKIDYTIKDPKTEAVSRRPFVFMPVSAPPAPGVVGFLGQQAHYAPGAVPIHSDPPPPVLCLPQ